MTTLRNQRLQALGALAAALALAACTPAASPRLSPTLAARPSSPATVTIVEPVNGAKVTGATVHVVLKLTGAEIVSATTTNVRPDQGHLHLYVNNILVSMNYGLEQDIPVQRGTFVLKAEFVAADHAPFSPQVWSDEVFFTVSP